MRTLILGFVAAMLAGSLVCRGADTPVTAAVCPLCGGKPTPAKPVSPATPSDMRLDLKSVGQGTDTPMGYPVCPKCHFVIFAADLKPEQLAICRKLVNGDSYRKHLARSPYYLYAVVQEALHGSPFEIGSAYLAASYEEEQDVTKLNEDLDSSLAWFRTALEKERKDLPDDILRLVQELHGELLRRLGHFADAEKHFVSLSRMPEFQGSGLVAFQLELVRRKDSAPHLASEMKSRPVPTTDPANMHVFAKSGVAVAKTIDELTLSEVKQNKTDGSDETAIFVAKDGAIMLTIRVYQGPADLKGAFMALNARGERIPEDNPHLQARYRAKWRLTEPSRSFTDEFEKTVDSTKRTGGLTEVREIRRRQVSADLKRDDSPIAMAVRLTGVLAGEGAKPKPVTWDTYLLAVNNYFISIHCTYPTDLDASRWGAFSDILSAINLQKVLPAQPVAKP